LFIDAIGRVGIFEQAISLALIAAPPFIAAFIFLRLLAAFARL